MSKKINLFFLIRIVLGCVFLLSGFEKLISPYQNFLFVVQSYEMVTDPWDVMVAKGLPWIELIVGVFLVLGLWIKYMIISCMLMIAMFLCVVGQAMIRQLPITECGCFGEFVSIPLYGVFLFDLALMGLTIWIAKHQDKASFLSLDRYFQDEHEG